MGDSLASYQRFLRPSRVSRRRPCVISC